MRRFLLLFVVAVVLGVRPVTTLSQQAGPDPALAAQFVAADAVAREA